MLDSVNTAGDKRVEVESGRRQALRDHYVMEGSRIPCASPNRLNFHIL